MGTPSRRYRLLPIDNVDKLDKLDKLDRLDKRLFDLGLSSLSTLSIGVGIKPCK